VNVPEYLALAAEGRLNEAANVIRRRNPFVSVCGRVCDHPCEKRCRRSEIDQPLAIRALKRYIADYMEDYETPIARPTKGSAEVAIVGSGPAGLSCAYFLALMQRPSIIFETQPIPGGMLSLGIPEFRLPKDILNKEIGFILSHGIQLKTETRIGNALDLLKEGFKAVFVATGGQRGKSIDIEGNDLNGVLDALEFLRDRGLGKGMELIGKRIVILGGGNAAVDVSRSAIRLGAKEVTILYRRTRNEMPAYEEEIDGALEEGVKLITLGIPKRIISEGQTVTAIEFLQAELGEADADGRLRPVPVEGTETKIKCDIVIPAIGQNASTESVNVKGGPELTKWGTIKVNPVDFSTTVDSIFSGGDCVTGPASVIEAISAGQKAAVSIDKKLGGNGNLPHDIGFTFTKPDEEALAKTIARPEEKSISLNERKRGFAEVVLGLDRPQAFAEAGRCLRCDLEK
jgi:NADH-quinone oxidoreductase subunit F